MRRLTINMPCFKPIDGEFGETSYVVLPGDILDGYGQFKPFVPPFLKPPYPPPHFVPPTPPVVPPHVKPILPPNMSDDIFEEQDIDDGDDLFADLGKEEGVDQEGNEETPNQPLYVNPGYEVAYENYHANTYSNVIVKKSVFNKNERQFLAVETEDA